MPFRVCAHVDAQVCMRVGPHGAYAVGKGKAMQAAEKKRREGEAAEAAETARVSI